MNRLIKFSFLLFFLIVSFGFFLRAPQANAANDGNIGAYPTNYDISNPKTKSWFIYNIKPGEQKEDSITVVNNSDATVNIKIYAVDATTTSDGAFALLNEDQRQTDIGSWVVLAKNVVTVSPRGQVDVPFTITVPKFATVGDHAGGIVIQEAKQATNASSGIGLNIVSRIGTRIYETVPGDKVVQLDVRNLSYKIVDDHLVFTFVMENTGNVILTPNGKLDIKNASGKIVDTVPLMSLGSVFPGKPTTLTAKSNINVPWFGQYNATVTINYSNTGAIAKSLSFFIYVKDWREVLPVPILLFVIALFFIVRKVFFHAPAIKEFVKTQKQLRTQDITDISDKVKTKVKSHVAKARKTMEQLSTTMLPQPVLLPAYEPNIDQMFIARHIKLLAVLVSVSIIVLSSLFAFVLQFLVLSKVTAAQKAPSAVKNTIVLPTPTFTPTPTDIPVAKEDMNIVVLNGTDTPGLAKKVADTLTAAGFSVTKVDNAKENRTQTLIEYPVDKHNGVQQLEEALKPDYTNIIVEASDSSSFTITLGK